MNADELYEHLCNGGTLTTRWKVRYSSISKPRLIHRLRLTETNYIDIQRSLISVLIHKGKLQSIHLQAGQYNYKVIE